MLILALGGGGGVSGMNVALVGKAVEDAEAEGRVPEDLS